MGVSALFILLCFLGPLSWPHGVVLVGGLALMLIDAYRRADAQRRRNGEAAAELIDIEDADPHMAPWKIGTLLAVGIVGLPLGAHLLIEGARGVAAAAGVSEAAIGLTLVAVGTSLPELVTTVMAALRRQTDVAIGNVVGSNLFNILAIMGVVSFISDLDVPPELLSLDLWVMIACGALLWPLIFRGASLGRASGFGLLGLYVLYAVIVLVPRM
jgi:Ca2+/Na+ antiporter